MKFLSRLWPFRGGDVATAVTDDDFVSVPRRPLRLTKLLAAPEHPYTLIPPIPLTERRPEWSDGIFLSQDETGLPLIWAGRLRLIGGSTDVWDWTLVAIPYAINAGEHTHWLPASVELLPARCCPPEVGR